MITPASKLMRKLAGNGATIFNDKLVDGRRSYKVWGWKEADYEAAAHEMSCIGVSACVVVSHRYSPRAGKWYMQPRLYVD